ncbi:hypothetical protein CsSME_00011891 [Camellia sinensis var. sinensis]
MRTYSTIHQAYKYTPLNLSWMAFELYGMLAGNVSPVTGEHIKPTYGGEEEAFLKKVVTPIYNMIAEVSVDCFRLGWPMRADADFFCLPIVQLHANKNEEFKPLASMLA